MKDTRRCKPPSKDGCHEYKPDKDYIEGYRIVGAGEKRAQVSGWCHDCRKRRARKSECIKREKAKQSDIARDRENVRIHKIFFNIRPTEVDRESRYVSV